jgi:signal transduction histidine kinase
MLTVTDTGRGIDPEELPRVMEKFYKGSSGQAGSGLGLAICKEIVEMHRGTLSVDSELGAGTTVTLILPLSK